MKIVIEIVVIVMTTIIIIITITVTIIIITIMIFSSHTAEECGLAGAHHHIPFVWTASQRKLARMLFEHSKCAVAPYMAFLTLKSVVKFVKPYYLQQPALVLGSWRDHSVHSQL